MNIEEYKEGIKLLNNRQIEALKQLYYSENHSATAKELAFLLGYKNFSGANLIIGLIGKKFSQVKNVSVKKYHYGHEKRPAYFELIGPYYENGWEMHEELCLALEDLEIVNSNNELTFDTLPTELMQFECDKLLIEGKARTVAVNKYERSTIARRKCVEHYGATCQICGFNFGKQFGEIAEGFILVHHIKPLSEINEQYQVDPINDLIPLCANCHSVIHLKKPAIDINELKKIISSNTKGQ